LKGVPELTTIDEGDSERDIIVNRSVAPRKVRRLTRGSL